MDIVYDSGEYILTKADGTTERFPGLFEAMRASGEAPDIEILSDIATGTYDE